MNTGEVVAGAGDQTIVTGDAVNVAARLEQAAPPGEILLGEDTFALVRDAVMAEPIERLHAKGKTEPVPAYRLIDVTPGAAGFARHLDAPIVGRERELTLLRGAFERTVSGSGVPAVHAPRRRRRGEVPAHGRFRRGARRSRDGPPRAVPVVRGGHHVLSGRRSIDRRGGPQRGRYAGGRSRQARSARGFGRAAPTRVAERVGQAIGIAGARRRRKRRSGPSGCCSSVWPPNGRWSS